MPLSCNLGTLTSWNPLGHSRPVTGLLYLTLILPSNLLIGFLRWIFPSGFPTKTQYLFLFSPDMSYDRTTPASLNFSFQKAVMRLILRWVPTLPEETHFRKCIYSLNWPVYIPLFTYDKLYIELNRLYTAQLTVVILQLVTSATCFGLVWPSSGLQRLVSIKVHNVAVPMGSHSLHCLYVLY